MLTQKRLQEILNYHPETGIFIWKKGKRRGKAAGAVNDKRGYMVVMIKGERILLHRLAFLWMTGSLPAHPGSHKDGNPSNNAWNKLSGSGSVTTPTTTDAVAPVSSYRGVFPAENKWRAEIRDPVTGNSIDLGRFVTPEGAYAAYCEAVMKMGRKFSRAA